MSALESAVSAPWAMLPERVEELLTIAAREHEWSPEALEAYRAQAADRGERMLVRDGVAILDVSGPLFKRANLFVKFSGATSYEIMRRDLQVALDDPAIHSIMLRVDSPGGEANGCDELAQAIYEARGKKPIAAYVSGMACSGGYWLASAADKVVVSDLAVLGSIGVVLGVTDRKKADEKNGVSRIEFVSSQSPGKRPDVQTDEGKARIQKMVDDLAEVFVTAVAKHRDVAVETVVEKFGAGGVEIGAKAVALGMADEVGNFEAALAALAKRGSNRRNPQRSPGEFFMSDKTKGAAVEGETTVDVAKIQAEASAKAKSETLARVKAIQGSEEGKARPKLAEHLAFSTYMPAEAAIELMKAAAVETVETSKTFEERKADAGALGLAQPEERGASNTETVQQGWKAAAERANARFGKDAVN
jgi:capsid assembly protease